MPETNGPKRNENLDTDLHGMDTVSCFATENTESTEEKTEDRNDKEKVWFGPSLAGIIRLWSYCSGNLLIIMPS
jgi:hypothetical protein